MTYTATTALKGTAKGSPAAIASWAIARGAARPDDVRAYLAALGGLLGGPTLAGNDPMHLRLGDAELVSNGLLGDSLQRKQADRRDGFPVKFGTGLPPRVFHMGERTHMVRIHARWIGAAGADVIGNHADWERTEPLLVEESVSKQPFPPTLQTPVTILVPAEVPVPATRLEIDGVQGVRIGRVSGAVSLEKPERFTLDPSSSFVGNGCHVRETATAAGTLDRGVFGEWASLFVYLNSAIVAVGVKAIRCRIRSGNLTELGARERFATTKTLLGARLVGHSGRLLDRLIGVPRPGLLAQSRAIRVASSIPENPRQFSTFGGVTCTA